MFGWLRRKKLDPELEKVLHEKWELQILGVTISLDRQGVSDDQVKHYFRRTKEIEEQYAPRLIEYLKTRRK